MKSELLEPNDYIASLSEDRKYIIDKLHSVITQNLPLGFEVNMGSGMLCYSVPHSIYPAGYHCNPALPLPLISLASQKNSVHFYHLGIYVDPELMQWFQEEFPKHSKSKLDMGKSCIRFKKLDEIPYELIGELCSKISVNQWIQAYEFNFKR